MTARLVAMEKAGVPAHLREGLALYLEHHLQAGHFLMAVLSNDLREAVARGDDAALAGLPATVRYLYNQAPGGAWGSWELVKDWLARRGAPAVDYTQADWISDCNQYRGRLLTGAGAHWCLDFDELPVDETCDEWRVCQCSARPEVRS